jgi:DNA-binding XRE family transcriptional regulator
MENMAEKRKEVGRPRIEVDENIIANLASIGCTQEEIASVVGVGRRTIQRNFGQIIEDNREQGKASLRRSMWKKALKDENVNMQIWLSKNVLNMRDKIETQNIVEPLPLIIEADVKDG